MKFLRVVFIVGFSLGVILGGILAVQYYLNRAERRMITVEDHKNTSGDYAQLGDGYTHYQLAGPDTGKVVVLLHGFSVPFYIWDGTFEYLVKKGFRVLRYDMLGRGFSDRPNVFYYKDIYYNQLNDLLDKLRLHGPVNLVGLSFGGMLATDFAGNFPDMVDKVVLIDPGYLPLKPNKPKIFLHYYGVTHPDELAKSQMSDFKYPERHPDWVKKYKVQMQFKGFIKALVLTRFNYDYVAKESNQLLESKHKPVLLIWGRDDKTVPFKYSDSVRKFLKVDFFPVDDAGHLPHIEQPDKVNAKIADFLRH